MDNEQLRKVILSLTVDCITRETARKMIAELYSIREIPQLTETEKIEGIKELMRMRLLTIEEGSGFVRRIIEDSVKAMGFVETKKGHATGSEFSHARAKNSHDKGGYKCLFHNGELQDYIVRAIVKGNKIMPAIKSAVAEMSGHTEEEIGKRVDSRVCGLYGTGVLDRKKVDGAWHYEAVEIRDDEQAGIKRFSSKKEIEAELRGKVD